MKQLHDESLMPFGKYVRRPLGKIPNEYWLWFLNQDWCDEWPELVKYANYKLMTKYDSTEAVWERDVIHPRATELMDKIRQVDSAFNWKFGGDGDNGEEMLLILTSVFEADDKAERLRGLSGG